MTDENPCKYGSVIPLPDQSAKNKALIRVAELKSFSADRLGVPYTD